MFNSLLLSAKAQPVTRAWTVTRPLTETVTVISSPSSEEEEDVENKAEDQKEPVNLPIHAVLPPQPTPLSRVTPDETLVVLQSRLHVLEDRLDTLGKSDDFTKVSLTQVLARLDEHMQSLKSELDKLEVYKASSETLSSKLSEISELMKYAESRAKLYSDQRLAEAVFSLEDKIRALILAVMEPETKADAPEADVQEPIKTEGDEETEAKSAASESLTVQERNLKVWPSRRTLCCVLSGVLTLVTTPAIMTSVYYYFHHYQGASSGTNDAFYPNFGAPRDFS